MEPTPVSLVSVPISVSLERCISQGERKAFWMCAIISAILWIAVVPLTVAFFGIPLILILLRLLSEAYLARKLKANMVRIQSGQFPVLHQAYEDCRKALGISKEVDIYIIQSGEINAFSLGLLRRRVVILNSIAVEDAIQDPAQVRFLLGHELTHTALDKTFKGRFLIFRSAKFRAGREATCDRAGAACAGDAMPATSMLKRLLVGNRLYQSVVEEPVMRDGDEAKRGFLGWVLRQYATYPTAGDRLRGVRGFLEELRGASR